MCISNRRMFQIEETASVKTLKQEGAYQMQE